MKKLMVMTAMLWLSLSVTAQSIPALKDLVNRTWHNRDTAHTGVHKFHIDSSGTVKLSFYDSTGVLRQAILNFDRVADNYAYFKTCDTSKCSWLSVPASGVKAIAGNFKVADKNTPFEKLFWGGSRHPGGNTASPCPPNCNLTPAGDSPMYFSSVSCCTNHTPQRHCGSTDDELGKLSRTLGCVFEN